MEYHLQPLDFVSYLCALCSSIPVYKINEHCIEKYIALINRKRNNIFITNLKCYVLEESL